MRQQNISQRLCGWNAQKRKGYFFIDYAGVVVFGKAFFVCKVANRAGTCASRINDKNNDIFLYSDLQFILSMLFIYSVTNSKKD